MSQDAMNERTPGVNLETDVIDGRAIGAGVAPTVDLPVFGSAGRTYLRLLSRAAHAWGTPESAALLPGITAQPPFST